MDTIDTGDSIHFTLHLENLGESLTAPPFDPFSKQSRVESGMDEIANYLSTRRLRNPPRISAVLTLPPEPVATMAPDGADSNSAPVMTARPLDHRGALRAVVSPEEVLGPWFDSGFDAQSRVMQDSGQPEGRTMTARESPRAAAESRAAVGASSTPVSAQETALRRYLTGTAYRSTPLPPQAAAGRVSSEDGRRTATPDTDGVLVGVDGSAAALHAALWAAAEADRHHVALHLVHAYQLPAAGVSGYNPYPPHLLADLRENGGTVLSDAASQVQRAFPDLPITTLLTYGDPATVLHHISGQAYLTVVGTHGANRFAVAMGAVGLGSVAAGIANTCPGPVAVIHPDPVPGWMTANAPVVVGVDGSPTSTAAIAFACEAARARRVPLIAVHCWTDPRIDGPVPSYSAGIIDPHLIAEEERARLAHELAEWVVKYPDVDIEQAVVHERPGPGLLGYAATAQLIVTGSRGHSGLAGMVLGSTSQSLIARSTCPIVIVRPTTERPHSRDGDRTDLTHAGSRPPITTP